MLESLLKNDTCTPMMGVFDPFSAKLSQQCGFSYGVLSGYSLAATHLGVPDIGILTQTEVLAAANRILNACPDYFLLVDGDNGHGDSQNVARLVGELKRMGAGGVIIEDQVWPKKCGHMDNKRIVSPQEHIDKIKLAKDIASDTELIVVARTDAIAVEGFESALERAILLREHGADVVFVEAPTSKEQLIKVRESLDCPLVANLIPGGKTPMFSRADLSQMGYSIAFYALNLLYSATAAMISTLKELDADKIDNKHLGCDFDTFNKIIGLDEYNLSR